MSDSNHKDIANSSYTSQSSLKNMSAVLIVFMLVSHGFETF